MIYFSAVGFRGWQTGKVESEVAQIANTYTNAVQLQARFGVLKERAQLKYAALDCWKLMAQELPQGVLLQRMSFSDGHRLTLSGSTTPDMVNTLFDFDTALRKVKLADQPVFDPQSGDHVNPRTAGNATTWSLSMDLLHTEKETP
jgi:hypothetical protein